MSGPERGGGGGVRRDDQEAGNETENKDNENNEEEEEEEEGGGGGPLVPFHCPGRRVCVGCVIVKDLLCVILSTDHQGATPLVV